MNEKAEGKVIDLEAKLDALTQEVERLKDELASNRPICVIQEHQAQAQEITRLQKAILEEKRGFAIITDELRQEIAREDAEIESVRRELMRQLSNAQADLKGVAMRESALRTELSQEKESNRNNVANYEMQVSDLKTELSQKSNDVEEISRHRDFLNKENDRLESELSQKTEELEKLKAEDDLDLISENVALREKVRGLEEQNAKQMLTRIEIEGAAIEERESLKETITRQAAEIDKLFLGVQALGLANIDLASAIDRKNATLLEMAQVFEAEAKEWWLRGGTTLGEHSQALAKAETNETHARRCREAAGVEKVCRYFVDQSETCRKPLPCLDHPKNGQR